MSNSQSLIAPLIAVDVGNRRVKLGLFGEGSGQAPLEPIQTLEIASGDQRVPGNDMLQLVRWISELPDKSYSWAMVSVNQTISDGLANWIQTRSDRPPLRILSWKDLPLNIALKRPERVGIDRLAAAVAANRLRRQDKSAIVIDLGSAITIDLVSAEGDFLGGAILPGMGMSARMLHESTDALPHVEIPSASDPDDFQFPSVLGKSTEEAIQSGVYWGAVGAIRHIVERLSSDVSEKAGEEPQVFVTGGAAVVTLKLLGDVRHVPHMVLTGVALSAM